MPRFTISVPEGNLHTLFHVVASPHLEIFLQALYTLLILYSVSFPFYVLYSPFCILWHAMALKKVSYNKVISVDIISIIAGVTMKLDSKTGGSLSIVIYLFS